MVANKINKKSYCPYCGSSIEKYYSPESTAKLLECSVEFIRKLIRTREISYKKIGRLVRIPSSEIDRLGQYYPSIYSITKDIK